MATAYELHLCGYRPAALRRHPIHHLEVAPEVMRAEELLLDPALGGTPDFLRALAVREQPADRRPNLLKVSRVRQQQA